MNDIAAEFAEQATKPEDKFFTDFMDVPDPLIRSGEFFAGDRAKLHPALQPYLIEDGAMGPMLRHPLVYQIVGVLWKLANDQYEAKSKALDAALDAEDWHRALFLHERPWRLDVLDEWYRDGIIDLDGLRSVLPDVWTDAENPSQHGPLCLNLFREAGFITDNVDLGVDDRPPFADLPPIVTVYRGTGTGEKPGISWTTDIHIASWFARRFRENDSEHRLGKTPGTGDPLLLTGTVKRADILGYFTDRGESEVVINPRKVRNTHAIALPLIEETWKRMGRKLEGPEVVPADVDPAEYRKSKDTK